VALTTMLALGLGAAGQSEAASTTFSGGHAWRPHRQGTTIGITQEDGGGVHFATATSVGCRHTNFPNIDVDGHGTVHDGVLKATGKSEVDKGLTLVMKVTGKIDVWVVHGRISARLVRSHGGPAGCHVYRSLPFVALAAVGPHGEAQLPAAGTTMYGWSGQTHGKHAIGLGIVVAVGASGKTVSAGWRVDAICRWGLYPITNISPFTRIHPDGRFARTERFKLGYGDGTTEHYRVAFKGQFHADGAEGTLQLHIRTTNRRGRNVWSCDTGPRYWWAMPPPAKAPAAPPQQQQQQPAPPPGQTPPGPGRALPLS